MDRSFSNEFNTLIAIIAERNSVDFTDVDPKKLFLLARKHKCVGIVERKLQQLDHAPESFTTKVSAYHKQAKQHNLKKRIEISAIAQLAGEINIPIVNAKGPVLSKDLYGDPDVKHSGDIDWFIYPEDSFVFYQALTKAGYRNDFGSVNFTPKKWQAIINAKHDISFTHPTRGVKNEVHWAAENNNILFPKVLYQEMMGRRQAMAFGTTRMEVFSREYLFLYLCFHGAKHAWASLSWIADIHQILNNTLDLDLQQAKAIAERYDLINTIDLAIALDNLFFKRSGYFGSMTYNKKLRYTASYCVTNLINTEKSKKANYWRNRLYFDPLLFRNFKSIFAYLKGMTFNPADMILVDIPDQFFFLYYILRPFLWIHKFFKITKLESKIVQRTP